MPKTGLEKIISTVNRIPEVMGIINRTMDMLCAKGKKGKRYAK